MKFYNETDVTKLSADEVNKLVVEIGKQGKFAGIIYCYTNQINGKRYIGQTTRPHTRHTQHISASNDGSVFHRVIQRYGAKLFTYSILEFFVSGSKTELQSTLNDSEISYIESYQSLVKQHGYNVAPGGNYNGSGEVAKAVDMYSMTGEFIESFDSISDANRKFGFSGPTIRQVCNHNHHTAGGYLWTWKGEQPLIPEEKCVCAYDLDGKFVVRFNNAFEASKMLGFKAIGKSCASHLKACTQDHWRRAEGYYWCREKFDKIEIPLKTSNLGPKNPIIQL